MKYLVNNKDSAIFFAEDELDQAKEYYKEQQIAEDEFDDFSSKEVLEEIMASIEEFNKDLARVDDIQELADLLNQYSDMLSDGRYHEVKEYN